MDEKSLDNVTQLKDPNHYREITSFHLEKANIPRRLFKQINPNALLERDREKINKCLHVWSDNTHRTLDQGLLFYHNAENSFLPDVYMAYLLVGAMRRRRSGYCVSMLDLDALEFGDPEFVEFLITRDVLGIYNFPHMTEKTIQVLNRIITRRFDCQVPTLYSSMEPNFPKVLAEKIAPKIPKFTMQAFINSTVFFEIGE